MTIGYYNHDRKTDQLAALKRRERVGFYRAQGYSIQQIALKLSEVDKLADPLTGKPWATSKVSSDIRMLERMWQERICKRLDRIKARQFAEIAEVRKAAWDYQEHKIVLDAIRLEHELLLSSVFSNKSLSTDVDKMKKLLEKYRREY